MKTFFVGCARRDKGYWDTDEYKNLDVSGLADKVFGHLQEARCTEEQESFRILNLGSGDGVNIIKLARERDKYLPGVGVDKPIEVVGIDYSPEMVVAAQKRLALDLANARDFRATTIRGDASAIEFSNQGPVREGSFDAVVSVSAFHWVPNQQGIVDSMAKALKPGGIMAIEFAWRSPVIIEETINRLLQKKGIEPSEDRWQRTDADKWNDMLRDGGFDAPDIEVVRRNQKLNGPDGMLKWLQTFIKGVDNFIGNVPEDQKDGFLKEVVQELKGTELYDKQSDSWHVTYERLAIQAKRSREIAVDLPGTNISSTQRGQCFCAESICPVM